jgi:hypothetical protein
MSVEILTGTMPGSQEQRSCLVDSVSGWVFGPLFHDEDDAEEFIQWVIEHRGCDPRALAPSDLRAAHMEWIRGRRSR